MGAHPTPHTWGTVKVSLGQAMEQLESSRVQSGVGPGASIPLHPGEQRGHKQAPVIVLIPAP